MAEIINTTTITTISTTGCENLPALSILRMIWGSTFIIAMIVVLSCLIGYTIAATQHNSAKEQGREEFVEQIHTAFSRCGKPKAADVKGSFYANSSLGDYVRYLALCSEKFDGKDGLDDIADAIDNGMGRILGVDAEYYVLAGTCE